MDFEIKGLKRAEAATLRLRSLYESYGYRKYRMGRFEEYSLYAANMSFLISDHVLTFTDLDGRLMALKPDITLGIAKNTKAGKGSCEKVYYIESVYRESKESHTYKEISQMGLECMGAVDDFVITEVLTLAVRSLAAFGVDYVLKISNMDFVVGMLDALDVGRRVKEKLLSVLRTKNKSGLEALCRESGLSEWDSERLLKLLTLYGSFEEVLSEAAPLADSRAMKQALLKLELIYDVLKAAGLEKKVRLDFSMINDIEYYNGIIFQGYLDGLARHVLSGGQYDGMMAKLKKPENAIGFALYLNELDWLPEKKAAFDTEALVLYDKASDLRLLNEAVEKLRSEGLQVRVEQSIPKDLRFGKLYCFDRELTEIEDKTKCSGQEKDLQDAEKTAVKEESVC